MSKTFAQAADHKIPLKNNPHNIGHVMEIEIIKKIGAGVNGTVFLIKSGGRQYIYKIEKYKFEKEPLKSSYARQIDFDTKVAQAHKDKFMTLKQYGIITNCKHTQNIPKWIKGAFRKELEKKNAASACSFLVYDPVLKYTWHDIKKQIFRPPYKLWHQMLSEIFMQLQIMKKAGFAHNDIHGFNVMYNGRQFYLIDYGTVSHEDYPSNKADKNIKKYGVTDIMMLLWNILIWNQPADHMIKNNIAFPKFKIFYNNLRKTDEYKKCESLFPRKLSPDGLKMDVESFIVVSHYPDVYKKILKIDDPLNKLKIVIPDINILTYIARHVKDLDYSTIIKKINS